MYIDLPTKPLQKKQSQNTIIKFIKILVKFICEKHTDEKTYVRLVADKTEWNADDIIENHYSIAIHN